MERKQNKIHHFKKQNDTLIFNNKAVLQSNNPYYWIKSKARNRVLNYSTSNLLNSKCPVGWYSSKGSGRSIINSCISNPILMNTNPIKKSYLIIPICFFLAMCTPNETEQHSSFREVAPVAAEEILFAAKANLYLINYDRERKQFIGFDQETFYLFDQKGGLLKQLNKTEGPNRYNVVTSATLSSSGNLVILTRLGLLEFTWEGDLVNRYDFPTVGMVNKGYFNPPRLYRYNDGQGDAYIFAQWDEEDQQYPEGSLDKIRKSKIIKTFNFRDKKVVSRIGTPPSSPLSQKLFQPLYLEPFINFDEKRQQLAVLFGIDPVIYIYDVQDFTLQDSLVIPIPEQMKFPKGLPFEEKDALLKNFTNDMDGAQFMHLQTFDGTFVVQYTLGKLYNQERGGIRLDYLLLDQSGHCSHFSLDNKNAYLGMALLLDDSILFYANYELLEKEPEGLLGYKVKVE